MAELCVSPSSPTLTLWSTNLWPRYFPVGPQSCGGIRSGNKPTHEELPNQNYYRDYPDPGKWLPSLATPSPGHGTESFRFRLMNVRQIFH